MGVWSWSRPHKKASRRESVYFKRMTSKYFYKFINFCSSVDIQPGTADFRLLDAKWSRYASSCKRTPFSGVDWFHGWDSGRIILIMFEPSPSWEKANTLWREWSNWWDGISSSVFSPSIATVLGVTFFCILYMFTPYMVFLLRKPYPAGHPWLFYCKALVLYNLFLGILGEYIGKILCLVNIGLIIL